MSSGLCEFMTDVAGFGVEADKPLVGESDAVE
jgi:hypothetical protein